MILRLFDRFTFITKKEPMSRLILSEVFQQLAKLKTKEEKITHLRHHAHAAVFYVLWVAMSGKVEWLLPKGAPKLDENAVAKVRRGRPGSEPSDLLRELRKLYLYLKGTGDHLTKVKREKLFRATLEDMSEEEGQLLIAVKDGKFAKTYGVTPALLEETFPGLLTDPHMNNKFVR
jgi:hypothetical protein